MPEWKGGGFCRWCNGAINWPNGRPAPTRSWHSHRFSAEPDCQRLYAIVAFGNIARWEIQERDQCRCAKCGATDKDGWQLDHIHPLHKVDRTAPDARRYWTTENYQTLCAKCHKQKSAGEAAVS